MKWGLVGYGDLAGKRVAAALQQAPGSTLDMVWGRCPDKTRAFASRHAIPVAASSLEQLLAANIDAVYVCTPPDSHQPYTVQAAAAGKHVLVEKPMAGTAADCETMIAAAAAAGVQLGVAYYRRAFPKMQRMRELVRSGALGELIWGNIACHSWFAPEIADPKHWRIEPARSGGAGALADIGVHRLDLLEDWLGPCRVAAALFTNTVHRWAVEDASSLMLQAPNGAPVHAFFAWNSKAWSDRFELVGSEAKLIAEPLDGPSLTIIRGREREDLSLAPPDNAHLPLVADFVTACAAGRAPLCDGATGMRATVLMEEAIRLGGR